MFPRKQYEREARTAGAVRRRQVTLATNWHSWQAHQPGSWRCSNCLILRKAEARGDLLLAGCRGKPALLEQVHGTHDLSFPEVQLEERLTSAYGGKPLMACLRCGWYAQQRADLL